MISMSVLRKRDKQELEKFADAQGRIGNFIANQISAEFAGFVRKYYLSGQVLKVYTGETRSSLKFFKLKHGSFGVRPGSGIRGRLNYLKLFERGGGTIIAKKHDRAFLWFFSGNHLIKKRVVHMPSKPFMKPAFQYFRALGEPRKIAQRIYQALRKRLLPDVGGQK
jgi:hypothetical protein